MPDAQKKINKKFHPRLHLSRRLEQSQIRRPQAGRVLVLEVPVVKDAVPLHLVSSCREQ